MHCMLTVFGWMRCLRALPLANPHHYLKTCASLCCGRRCARCALRPAPTRRSWRRRRARGSAPLTRRSWPRSWRRRTACSDPPGFARLTFVTWRSWPRSWRRRTACSDPPGFATSTRGGASQGAGGGGRRAVSLRGLPAAGSVRRPHMEAQLVVGGSGLAGPAGVLVRRAAGPGSPHRGAGLHGSRFSGCKRRMHAVRQGLQGIDMRLARCRPSKFACCLSGHDKLLHAWFQCLPAGSCKTRTRRGCGCVGTSSGGSARNEEGCLVTCRVLDVLANSD